MTETERMPWDIGKLTLVQFLCWGNKRPPSQKTIESPADYMRLVEEQQREEDEWSRK